MGDVHQFPDFQGPSANEETGAPVEPEGVDVPSQGFGHRMSAVEYIVATARPGEVVHVKEGDYYSKHLWRSYQDLDSRYSCT